MTTGEKRGTILIVDDTPLNLEVLQDILSAAGFELLIAVNGESAIRQAEYATPDMILLDVMMPGIDGFETCRRLKELEATREIPIIFMTALSETSHKVRGFEMGGVDYVTKPLQHEEVMARLNTHLKLRNLQRELQLMNEELEQRVAARTVELTEANTQLQAAQRQLEMRVRELDGRNRLVQLQMSPMSLSEAHSEILEVAQQVLEATSVRIYLPGEGDSHLELAATTAKAREDSQAQISLTDTTSAIVQAYSEKKPHSDGSQAMVPILYSDTAKGVLWVDGISTEEAERKTLLNILWGIGQEAALVMRVAHVTADLAEGRIEVDELLGLQ